jgi:hypothetical protein
MNSRRFMVASTTGDRVLEDVSRINLRLDLHQSREVVAPPRKVSPRFVELCREMGLLSI